MEKLKNKIVFITGASSGIGAACAELFAEQKCKLILTARREEKICSISKKIEKNFDVDTLPIKLDITNLNYVQTVISSLSQNWKNIDILINNAGMARGLNKLYEDNINGWEEMIDTNIKGLLYISC